jgi:hypothetical protein
MLLALASCGDQSFFRTTSNSSDAAQISSLSDGDMLMVGAPMLITVSAPGSSNGDDYELEVTVTSLAGESVWHNRSAVTLDEKVEMKLPDTLPAGQYRVEYVLYAAGEEVQRKAASFFVVAAEGWKITGIKSFPLVITSAATVMLKAEMETPADADPYLRWTWKGKPIAKGMLSEGLDTILWAAPSDSGVYTVALELFPFPPAAGSDHPFSSTLTLSTDIVVSKNAAANTSDLAPDSSYLTVLHMQATLDDAGTSARKTGRTKAVAIGTPEIVVLDDGFGYKLDGSTGIRIPWLALPIDGGILKPFTISLGLSLTDPAAADTLVRAASSDGSLTLSMAMDPRTGGPLATLTAAGAAPLLIPWPGPALPSKQRVLLSLSIVPLGQSLTAQWFLDGVQVSDLSASFTMPALTQDGTVTIGGEKGFTGIVEEFGVYAQDSAGRPATDPDLYAHAQRKLLGAGVVLADGFDGINLSNGYTLQGKGQLTAGSLSLAAGASLTLPPVKIDGTALALTAGLASDSLRSAILSVSWEGESQSALSVTVVADAAGLRFQLAADGLSLTILTDKGEKTVTLPAAENDTALLLITLQNAAEAKSGLVLENVLLTRDST